MYEVQRFDRRTGTWMYVDTCKGAVSAYFLCEQKGKESGEMVAALADTGAVVVEYTTDGYLLVY